MALLLLYIAVSLTVLPPQAAAGGLLHPLVVVPGLGSSQLEARFTRSYVPSNPSCGGRRGRADGDWFRLWWDRRVAEEPLHTRCFAEQMTLHYDAGADDYRNFPGVETRAPHFGSTEGFRHRDPDNKRDSPEMAHLLQHLERVGYRDGETLFGAPYDFRYGLAGGGHPSRVGSRFLRDLKQLVEAASAANCDRPVIILSHSLGGLFVHRLLTRSPAAWSRRFVRRFVALAAPWGGAAAEMVVFGSGTSAGLSNVEPLLLRGLQRSFETNAWLLPSPGTFGKNPLVVTPGKNYSALDVSEFLADVGFPEGVRPYETRVLPLVAGGFAPPGVPVTCIVGVGVSTPEVFVYGRGGFDEQPEVVYGDGDGIVNLVSLLALETEWSGVRGQQPLKVIRIPNVTHGGILEEGVALREIMVEISDVNSLLLTSAA